MSFGPGSTLPGETEQGHIGFEGGPEQGPGENHSCISGEDAENEFALLMRDTIEYFPSYSTTEYGVTMAMGSDGVPFAVGNAALAGDLDETELYLPTDASNVFGTVHNHPSGGSDYNLLNRYPSDNDWSAADAFISNGADPNNFSMFIMDANGDLREFEYSDRALYQDLSQDDMIDGDDLPPVMQSNLANLGCV